MHAENVRKLQGCREGGREMALRKGGRERMHWEQIG